MLFSEQKVHFNKNETVSKMENFTHVLREANIVIQLIQESWIKKTKLWWIEARKKQSGFVLTLISPAKGIFCSVCISSQCIEYWINFQNIYTLVYQKTLPHTLLFLFLKSPKAFSASLKQTNSAKKNVSKASNAQNITKINNMKSLTLTYCYSSSFVGS